MKEFINKKYNYAIFGVSKNKEKWGYKVWKQMLKDGFKVFPINPKYNEIEGKKCYKNLDEIKKRIDVVITIVPPKVTEKIIDDVIKHGVKKIWFQPGSENEKVIKKCKKLGIKFIHKMCFVVDGLRKEFEIYV